MIYGNYYGIQYEVYLNKPIDLFNDVLSICIDIRKMISLEKVNRNSEKYKLVIIPYRELDSRLIKKQHIMDYISQIEKTMFNKKITRKSHPSAFKYYDVKVYSSSIKNKIIPQAYSEEMLKNLENQFEKLTKIFNELNFWDKYTVDEIKCLNLDIKILKEKIDVQRIIMNQEYFNEIKEIERELTDIELTNREKEIIEQIITHPKLKGRVECHGINLIEGFLI
jgi:hypothetical protein